MNNIWTYNDNFTVTKDMVDNGRFIEGKIPTVVTGFFDCSGNNLTVLEGGPNIVGGDFDCSSNELTNLEGGPNIVGGSFSCNHNQLTSLKGSPTKVSGEFSCSYNKLTSLKGCPDIAGSIHSKHNNIESFKDLDEGNGKSFNLLVCDNSNIRNLEGLENLNIKRLFISNSMYLESIHGIPKNILNKDFEISNHETFGKNSNIQLQLDFYINIYGKYTNYWVDMLQYYINNSTAINNIIWPKNFINNNLKQSVESISKFKL